MKRNRIEISVFIGLLAAVLMCFWGGADAQAVSEKLVRLHVIANSDNQADQQLKLEVRDAILPFVSEATKDCQDVEEARLQIKNKLPEIQLAAERKIAECDYAYAVRITLEECYFPSKYYDGFSLPAGEYHALKVIIGEGSGQNWWCVLFPPLCLPAAGANIEELAQEYGLDDNDIAFITENGCIYKLRFKSAEIYAEIKEWLIRSAEPQKQQENEEGSKLP